VSTRYSQTSMWSLSIKRSLSLKFTEIGPHTYCKLDLYY